MLKYLHNNRIIENHGHVQHKKRHCQSRGIMVPAREKHLYHRHGKIQANQQAQQDIEALVLQTLEKSASLPKPIEKKSAYWRCPLMGGRSSR